MITLTDRQYWILKNLWNEVRPREDYLFYADGRDLVCTVCDCYLTKEQEDHLENCKWAAARDVFIMIDSSIS